jgi:hypothetical protein
MEKDKKGLDRNQADPNEVFPESDPDFEDLKELEVEPFLDSDIFLDKKLKKKKPS